MAGIKEEGGQRKKRDEHRIFVEKPTGKFSFVRPGRICETKTIRNSVTWSTEDGMRKKPT
jgi:hypothetical protein